MKNTIRTFAVILITVAATSNKVGAINNHNGTKPVCKALKAMVNVIKPSNQNNVNGDPFTEGIAKKKIGFSKRNVAKKSACVRDNSIIVLDAAQDSESKAKLYKGLC